MKPRESFDKGATWKQEVPPPTCVHGANEEQGQTGLGIFQVGCNWAFLLGNLFKGGWMRLPLMMTAATLLVRQLSPQVKILRSWLVNFLSLLAKMKEEEKVEKK